MPWETRSFEGRDQLPVVTIVVGWTDKERRLFMRLGRALTEFQDTPPTDALVDTGSYRTFVPESFVRRLGLLHASKGVVRQALGATDIVEFYAARIQIVTRSGLKWKQHAVMPSLPVGVLPTRGDPSRTLAMPILGRDALAACVLKYDGPNRQLSIQTAPRGRGR
jgi:hypothetical protein